MTHQGEPVRRGGVPNRTGDWPRPGGVLLGALVFVVWCRPAVAQADAPPVIGERIRVTTAVAQFVGRFDERRADTVVVSSGNTVALFTQEFVVSVEARRCCSTRFEGAKRGVGLGALFGLVIGGASAAIGCSTDNIDCTGSGGFGPTFESRVAGFLAGRMVAGMIVGGVIGALTPPDRWQAFPLEAIYRSVPPPDRARDLP